MRFRVPLAVALVPVGLLIGALLVGRPTAVEDDIVLEPAVVQEVSTLVTTTVPLTEGSPDSTDAPGDSADAGTP